MTTDPMTDIAALVAENIDIWTSAIQRKSGAGRGGGGKRISLYGIERLRALILDLAVRGKLVPQDAGDEPASELLKRIPGDWALSRRRSRSSGVQAVETANQTLPSGWAAIPGNTIFRTRSGNSKLIKGKLFAEDGPDRFPGYSASGQDVWLADWEHDAVAIILSAVGARCGKAFLARGKWSAVANTHIVWLNEQITDADFAMLVLNNENFWDRAGGAQPFIKVGNTLDRDFLLPPLAEQRRIVAKVDELMALCDALERESAGAMAAHQALVEALLAALVNSADAADLARQWARLESHFDTLFTTDASIEALKQTILDLAVRGKLVEQDAADEAADKMLRRIASDKTKSGKPGKGRASAIPNIADTEVPFEIPHGWAWARFSQIAAIRAELVQSLDFPDAVQIAPDVIEKGTGKLLTIRTVAEAGVRGPNSRFYAGQIIYSKIRPSLSKAVIAESDGLCSADMYPLDARIDTSFLLRLILSEPFLQQVRIAENRIKMPKLNKESLNAFVVPIPPLAEQRRIVAKVDALMALCDALKARLADAAQTQRHLADAITQRAAA